jgi:NAD(P)-dependent dehydrogenase (short-subunit alcohol dehydrogenase family)
MTGASRRMRLESKTALVTGGTSNIGRAIALAFAAEGAHVVVSGRSPGRGAEVVERIRAAGGRADFVAADLDGSRKASRDLAAKATHVLGGRIDVLYNSTKGAVETLTKAWAAEFGPAGVRVNAISPGVIRTPNADGSDSGAHPAEVMMRGTPAGRSGTPDAVAHAAVYLASDEAAFVHGTVIDVDGGRTGVAVVAS